MELGWQLFVSGLVTGSTIALVAYGFGLTFWIARTFHFAHGAIFAGAGYTAYVVQTYLNPPLPITVVLTVAASVALGLIVERGFYRPLRRAGAAKLSFLITSVGLLIVGESALLLTFGPEHRTLAGDRVKEGWNVAGAFITPVDVAAIASAIALFVALQLFLRRTRQGRLLRAVADNPDMAGIVGINVERSYLISAALGSALAAPAGLLVALDQGLTPEMGLTMILFASIAVLVGGITSVAGALVGSYALALSMSLGVWKLPTEWQDAIAFAVLLVFIVFRPHGFFGQKLSAQEI